MGKIARFAGNLLAFANNAAAGERTVFGSASTSDTLDDNVNTDWLRGWGIVTENDFPTAEDFNAMGFTLGQLIAYLHQMGVGEWHTDQEYHEGSLCVRNETVYRSYRASNVGNDPENNTSDWVALSTGMNGSQRISTGLNVPHSLPNQTWSNSNNPPQNTYHTTAEQAGIQYKHLNIEDDLDVTMSDPATARAVYLVRVHGDLLLKENSSFHVRVDNDDNFIFIQPVGRANTGATPPNDTDGAGGGAGGEGLNNHAGNAGDGGGGAGGAGGADSYFQDVSPFQHERVREMLLRATTTPSEINSLIPYLNYGPQRGGDGGDSGNATMPGFGDGGAGSLYSGITLMFQVSGDVYVSNGATLSVSGSNGFDGEDGGKILTAETGGGGGGGGGGAGILILMCDGKIRPGSEHALGVGDGRADFLQAVGGDGGDGGGATEANLHAGGGGAGGAGGIITMVCPNALASYCDASGGVGGSAGSPDYTPFATDGTDGQDGKEIILKLKPSLLK